MGTGVKQACRTLLKDFSDGCFLVSFSILLLLPPLRGPPPSRGRLLYKIRSLSIEQQSDFMHDVDAAHVEELVGELGAERLGILDLTADVVAVEALAVE